jgi:two-component system chemotaxis response regulator CheB
MKNKVIIIGASAGGVQALQKIIGSFEKDFSMAVIIVQHLHPQSDDFMIRRLAKVCSIPVKEAEKREMIKPGMVYVAPPNYHLLIEEDKSFALSTDPRVNFCRPSIDVLFESAADIFGSNLIGIILSGANNDGAMGMKKIKKLGGMTIVQDPATAESDIMPGSVLNIMKVDAILTPEKIGNLLQNLDKESVKKNSA